MLSRSRCALALAAGQLAHSFGSVVWKDFGDRRARRWRPIALGSLEMKQNTTISKRNHKLSLESLECRHMLTSIGLTDDGLVQVEGTNESDNISVFVAEDRFVVEVNGAATSFNNNDVSGLHVEALNGDDRVTIDSSVLQPTLVFGGAGDDTIQGGAGVDVILGGSGNDTILGNTANDILLGDGPNSLAEVPLPQPNEAGLDSAANAQVVVDIAPVDTAAPDSDPLALQKYLSRISNINEGSDTIVGGTGHDMIFAGRQNDRVAGDGPNTLPTDGVADAIFTGEFDAVQADLVPVPANDYIEAGAGNDVVASGPGNDLVFGGAGNDTLNTGRGNDAVVGGSGNDVIDAGAGRDRVLGDGPNTINQVITVADDIYLANSRLGGGHDYIEAGAGNDSVYGGRGNDVVFAGAGDDFAHGGAGNDLLVGGTGADTLIGGFGNDVIITGGPNQGPLVATADVLSETLVRDASLAHDRSNDYVEAGAGDDRVLAFGGHDLVFGGTGNDNLSSGGGNDILVGGDGNDVLSSGAGNDIVLGDGPNSLDDAILPMPRDAAELVANPSLLDIVLANSVLGEGRDVIDGGAGDDWMFGGAGNDAIFGRAGNDILHGGHGDDFLFDDLNTGGSGVDIFFGDCGADKIFANDGPDGPVDYIFYDLDDELHVDGEDELLELPPC